jgi:hypothetical protein
MGQFLAKKLAVSRYSVTYHTEDFAFCVALSEFPGFAGAKQAATLAL